MNPAREAAAVCQDNVLLPEALWHIADPGLQECPAHFLRAGGLQKISCSAARHPGRWIDEPGNASLVPAAWISSGSGGEHIEKQHGTERIRIPASRAVKDLQKAGFLQEGVHEPGIAEVGHNALSPEPTAALWRDKGRIRPAEFPALRIEGEYPALLTLVDAGLLIKNPPQIGVRNRCP